MSSLVFSLDIEEELWDSTKLSFFTMFTIISIYKNQTECKERRKERKEGSKTKKEDWFGESEIMLECRVVFS
jgi:hypothetical protein